MRNAVAGGGHALTVGIDLDGTTHPVDLGFMVYNETNYPEFTRLWEYYLAYCEGGFRERAIGCVQMLFTKPRFDVEAA